MVYLDDTHSCIIECRGPSSDESVSDNIKSAVETSLCTKVSSVISKDIAGELSGKLTASLLNVVWQPMDLEEFKDAGSILNKFRVFLKTKDISLMDSKIQPRIRDIVEPLVRYELIKWLQNPASLEEHGTVESQYSFEKGSVSMVVYVFQSELLRYLSLMDDSDGLS